VTGEQLDASALFRDGLADALRPILRDSITGGHSQYGVANKLLHPPSAAARVLILECTDEAALVSHGIDADAREELRRGNASRFLMRRAASLRQSTEAFFARQMELERDDAPSLAAITRRIA
jgi:hypothetical protein